MGFYERVGFIGSLCSMFAILVWLLEKRSFKASFLKFTMYVDNIWNNIIEKLDYHESEEKTTYSPAEIATMIKKFDFYTSRIYQAARVSALIVFLIFSLGPLKKLLLITPNAVHKDEFNYSSNDKEEKPINQTVIVLNNKNDYKITEESISNLIYSTMNISFTKIKNDTLDFLIKSLNEIFPTIGFSFLIYFLISRHSFFYSIRFSNELSPFVDNLSTEIIGELNNIFKIYLWKDEHARQTIKELFTICLLKDL